MRKIKIFCLAAALLLILCAAGCAQNDSLPSASGEAPAAPEQSLSPSPTPIRACLELEGGEVLEWQCGIPFEDPGFIAKDSSGAGCSEQVLVEGEVTCWKVGEYTLRYSFKDAKDGELSATRLVKVVPAQLPEAVPTEKVIYLTFDDGPCCNTQTVLDILAKYDAKATFFIIAKENDYTYLIPEIEAQGHTVGVHCAVHSYADIYASEEAYFNDFMKAQQFYYEQLGHYASISRFPGGGATANTFFAKTVEGGLEQIEQRLLDMGIRYYDWDIQEAETGSLDTYYIFKGYVPKFDMPVFLQHDARDYSIAALESMLIWGLENGYEFRAISDTTPQRGYIRPMRYA